MSWMYHFEECLQDSTENIVFKYLNNGIHVIKNDCLLITEII